MSNDNVELGIDSELLNDQKNIKLNSTDLEVLEKKVTFFPSDLLKEPTRTKKINNSYANVPFNNMRPQVNQETLPKIIPQNVAIRPIFQLSGNRRGIGMRMF